MTNITLRDIRYYHTRNLEFKNKVIAYLDDYEFSTSEFKNGLEKIKETDKFEVYYYSAKNIT